MPGQFASKTCHNWNEKALNISSSFPAVLGPYLEPAVYWPASILLSTNDKLTNKDCVWCVSMQWDQLSTFFSRSDRSCYIDLSFPLWPFERSDLHSARLQHPSTSWLTSDSLKTQQYPKSVSYNSTQFSLKSIWQMTELFLFIRWISRMSFVLLFLFSHSLTYKDKLRRQYWPQCWIWRSNATPCVFGQRMILLLWPQMRLWHQRFSLSSS